MTPEEIQNAQVPLPWYRDALMRLWYQERAKMAGDMTTDHLAGRIITGFQGDPEGLMCEWMGATGFIGSIEVKTGDLLWFTEKGGMWIETVYMKQVPEHVRAMARPIRKATKSGYTEAYKDRKVRNCPVDASVIDLTNPTGSPTVAQNSMLASYGVRIG